MHEKQNMSLISRLFVNKQRFQGKKIILRPLYKKEISLITLWFSNYKLLELGFGILRETPNFTAITTSYLKHLTTNRDQFFAIEAPEVGFIGFISHHIVDYQEGVGRIGILIGNQSAWGKGYGRDAVSTALWYLFIEKGLSKVELDTAEFNKHAQHCFEACGFIIDEKKTETQKDENQPRRIWYEINRLAFIEQHRANFDIK